MLLIFGGTGFLGKHLLVRLEREGIEAVSVSRSPDLGFISDHAPSVRPVPLDRLDDADLADLIDQASHVVYLASASTSATHANEPWRDVEQNVVPAVRVFSAVADRASPPPLLFVSSGGTIYGDGHQGPACEQQPPAPVSPYALHKLMLEETLAFLGRSRGLPHQILRVSNPVGYWQENPNQGIVQVAVRSALQDRAVRIFGDGSQVRDYVDADDVADALLRAVRSESLETDVLNVGSGVGRSVEDVLAIVEAVSGREIRREYLPARPSDVHYSVLDCRRIERSLGWVAKTPLEASVERVWQRWSTEQQMDLSDRRTYP